MGGGGSKPADVYKVDGYQIVTGDGRQCLRVDPNKIVENEPESVTFNFKDPPFDVRFGPCDPNDPWQIWNAKEDMEIDGTRWVELNSDGRVIDQGSAFAPGKISIFNRGTDGVERYLFSPCILSTFTPDLRSLCTGDAAVYAKIIDFKIKEDLRRHWEIFKVDSADQSKVNIKYHVWDPPKIEFDFCIRMRSDGSVHLAPCVPAEHLLFEPKGRKTDPVVQQAPPGPGPNAAEWTANVSGPAPAPGPAPPLTDASPTQAPAPETSALAPAPSALSSPAPSAISYYDVAPSPAVEENWWKKNQTMFLIGGGVLLCLCVFMIVAFVLFM